MKRIHPNVTRHGGRIRYDDQNQKGDVFEISFPKSR